MESFENIFDALRKIKELSGEMGEHDDLHLVCHEYSDTFHVTDDEDEVGDFIEQKWDECAWDGSPESYANDFKIYQYSHAFKKEKYPNTFRNAKRSVIGSDTPLVRRVKSVAVEYSVSFGIE